MIDIGGTSVKLWHTGHEEHRKFESGKSLTPDAMVAKTIETVKDWEYEAIALGLPAQVSGGRPVEDPPSLGAGWVSYNFSAALGKPIRILNDAALQALGGFDGGRMLFIGLGTGVGSALIADRLVLTLDIGRLRYGEDRVFEVLGDAGLDRLGLEKWRLAVNEITTTAKNALMADYVVLGGGNVKKIEELPDGVRRGHNRNAVEGGRRLWKELPDPAKPNSTDWVLL